MTESLYASCPYCGETVEVIIDEGGGNLQNYVEDCPVCCRPWEVEVAEGTDGDWQLLLRTMDD